MKILGKKINEQIGKTIEVKVKNITDKAIFAELNNGLTGMLHYKEISFDENQDNLKKLQKNDLIKVKLVEIKDEKNKIVGKSASKRSDVMV